MTDGLGGRIGTSSGPSFGKPPVLRYVPLVFLTDGVVHFIVSWFDGPAWALFFFGVSHSNV